MPKFACEHCESKIRVPDEFIGKRVKCPGCAKPVRVPGEKPADPGESLDLSLLDDTMSGVADAKTKPRKLRSIMIGCGACGKTIAIPENRMGAVSPCPKCKTPLRVDRLELPPTSGSTIDFKHIALEPAEEPSLAGDSFVAGSVAGLTSTGTVGGRGGSMSGSSRSGMGATGTFVGSSKDQMQELKALNDLRADGAISEDEYRRRKAEIYSGSGNLARQATSRAAGGARDRAIRVDTGPSIPRPVKWVIMLAIVAGVGYGGWVGIKTVVDDIYAEAEVKEKSPEELEAEAQARAEREAQRAEAERMQAEASREPVETQVVEAPVDPAMDVMMIEPGVPITADGSLFAEGEGGADGTQTAGLGTALADTPPDRTARPTPPPPPVRDTRPEPKQPVVHGTVALWPAMFPEARNTSNPMARALREACTIVREVKRAGASAIIGVGAGPAAQSTEDMAFRAFEFQTRQILVDTLGNVGEFENMIIDTNRPPETVAGVKWNKLVAETRKGPDANKQVVILTGVQDGYCLTYWFSGHKQAYRLFQQNVGTAVVE